LKKLGYQEDSIAAIVNAVTKRCEMNTRPVTIASYALDPRLQGANLTESEWLVACEVILRIAESEKLDRSQILGDFTEYRTKSGTVFGNDIVWEAVTTNACSQNPHLWWLSYASSSALAKVASILLTMPATAAIIERCNKAYAVVKTKTRNRLSPGRASTLAMVSYNLKLQRSLAAPTSRSDKRIKRNNIMALTVPFACAQPSEPPLPDCTPLAQQLDGDDDSVIDEEHGESDAGENANGTNSESDADIDDSDNNTDMEDNVASLPVSLMSGDWVAVKVFDKLPLSLKGKAKARSKFFLHVAQIEDIEEDKMFTVLFLKRYSDVERYVGTLGRQRMIEVQLNETN